MPPQPLFLLILGVAAGVLSGIFGIGGGIVIVPVLMTFSGFTQLQANGTSLAALLLPVGILAVRAYHQAGLLQMRLALIIAVGLLLGGFFGAEIAQSLPSDTLRRIYGVFLLWVSWRFFEPRKMLRMWLNRRNHTVQPVNQSAEPTEQPNVAWYIILVVGLIAGVFSGLFGIGGGLVIVPALVALLNFDQKRAVGTSLGALLMPVGLGGVISYYQSGNLDLSVAVIVALGLVLGAFLGAKIALGLPSSTVKRLYALFLLVVGIRFILGL